MPVDGALGEPRRQGDLIQGGDLKTSLGEQLQSGRDEERPRFRLAPLVNDSHEYLGYCPEPSAQDSEPGKPAELVPAGICDT